MSLSNKGYVKIRGQRADIIGKVCMDQLMVDVTEIKDVRIKDPVLIFGEDEYGSISLYEVANMAGTIVYDLLCGVSMRIPRVYYKDNEIYKIINYLSHSYPIK